MCSRRAAWVSCTLAIACLAPSTAARAEKWGASFSASPPSKVIAGEVFSFPVTVTNTGTETWTRDGCEAYSEFRLASHWLNGPQPVEFDFPNVQRIRSQVPATMKPGDSKSGRVFVRAPDNPGTYTLQLDVLWEDHHWFTLTGADKVPGGFQELSIEVQAVGAASPEVREVVAWEPLVTPNKLHRIYVLRTGPCAVDLSFSDGSPPQTLTADLSYVERAFDKLGDVTITATGTGGCSGSKSTTIEVGDTACPWFLLTLKVCTLWDFDCCATDPAWCPVIELPKPPKITSVDDGILRPAELTAIRGEWFTWFDKKPGKVELLLKDWQGNDVVAAFTGLLFTEPHWEKEVIYAQIDADLGGVRAQTAHVRVTGAHGQVSNLFPILFAPTEELRTLPNSAVHVDHCSDDVSCNQCNGNIDCLGGDAFSAPLTNSIVGSHQSIPLLDVLFGSCSLGGGSGTDNYSAHLKNGWHLASVVKNFLGIVPNVSGFAVGSTDISGSVAWSLESCQSTHYSINLIVAGPRGVPMQ